VIRVANTLASPPWSLLDDKNQPSGYDVEMAKEVAKRIGIAKVEFTRRLCSRTLSKA
jgi:cystine transport system substrate-binding protein